MNHYKITLSDGESYETGMNATLEEAKVYFLGQPNIIENFETGAETVRFVTKVEILE